MLSTYDLFLSRLHKVAVKEKLTQADKKANLKQKQESKPPKVIGRRRFKALFDPRKADHNNKFKTMTDGEIKALLNNQQELLNLGKEVLKARKKGIFYIQGGKKKHIPETMRDSKAYKSLFSSRNLGFNSTYFNSKGYSTMMGAGVKKPFFYIGYFSTGSMWHFEDFNYASVFLNLKGIKIWFLWSVDDEEKLCKLLGLPEGAKFNKDFIISFNFFQVLKDNNIQTQVVIQREGDVVLTMQKCPHMVLNLTYVEGPD